ncbi:MAG: hypothetical protein AAB401_00105 [Acidobacteriota bacterium]
MTREEAIRFKENWAAVNQVVIQEERAKSFELRLKELAMLFRTGRLLGWHQRPANDQEVVRARWQKLREVFAARITHEERD